MTDYALGERQPANVLALPTSVKDPNAHSRWVICAWDHSDGCERTFDISFSPLEMDLDGGLVREVVFVRVVVGACSYAHERDFCRS